MKFRLSLLLLVPAMAVIALAAIIVDDRDTAWEEARAAAELADFARVVASVDEALGIEAMAGAASTAGVYGADVQLATVEARSGADIPDVNLLGSAQAVTDTRLDLLTTFVTSSEQAYHPDVWSALNTVRETLRYREDITAGRISPLQIADRYSYLRHVLLESLTAQTRSLNLVVGVGPITGLSALVGARSAHLDERLTIDLAIRYDTWAPGQHAVAIEAVVRQNELLSVARAHLDRDIAGGGDPLVLAPTRSVVTQSMDVPPLTSEAWLAVSDGWLTVLGAEIAGATGTITERFAQAERSAATDRMATVASVGSTLMFAALMAIIVVIRMVRRVGRVTEQAELLALDAAADVEDIADVGRDEIGQLSRTFDEMASRLRRSAHLHAVESGVLEAVARCEPIETILELIAELLGVDELGQPVYAFSHHAPAAGVMPLFDDDSVTTLWLMKRGGGVVEVMPEGMEARAAFGLAKMAQARFDDDARIQFQIRHDPLTGMLSRATILASAATALDRCGSGYVGILYVDLDGFKPINDTYGHASGDEVLKVQARRLGAIAARNRGSAGRLGGDEFLLIAPRMATPDDIRTIAESIVVGLSGPVELGSGVEVTTGTSVGCVAADNTMAIDEWIHEADIALYEAKRRGRGGAVVSTEQLRERANAADMLSDEVRAALEGGQFVPFFQPVWGDGGANLIGLEALARWQRPVHGITSPGVFLPVVEELNEASRFDGLFFERVCSQVADWNRRGLPIGYVSINVSAARLEDPKFVSETLAALAQTGCDPSAIVIEVTEEGVMTDISRNGERLEELRVAGVRIAADDFGKGYSSLAYLHKLPVDIVKVDRQFVDGIDHSRTNRAIVSAIRALASAMELTLIAEGVERPEELAQLIELGCDAVQGFLLGKPMPLEETEVMIGQRLVRSPASAEWFALAATDDPLSAEVTP